MILYDLIKDIFFS